MPAAGMIHGMDLELYEHFPEDEVRSEFHPEQPSVRISPIESWPPFVDPRIILKQMGLPPLADDDPFYE